jgi:hypothetical protein
VFLERGDEPHRIEHARPQVTRQALDVSVELICDVLELGQALRLVLRILGGFGELRGP